MEFNVHHICSDYDFIITGASYMGRPLDHTVMYVTAKAASLLTNLERVRACLIYAEKGMDVPERFKKENCILFSDNPERDYALFMNQFAAKGQRGDRERNYRLTDGGYYVGENTFIGSDAYIEPFCVIGHDVRIGDHARIYSGTVIKNAVIGDDFLANEQAVVGANGFIMTEDREGNKLRIPSLGKVLIGNHVEIGAHNNISRGCAGDTVLEDFVKLDSLVHVGHDVHIGKNAEITSGTIVGGFDEIGCDSFIGLNATLRNRIVLGNGSRVSMGAAVTQNVEEGQTVTGNFAVDHELFLSQLKEKTEGKKTSAVQNTQD